MSFVHSFDSAFKRTLASIAAIALIVVGVGISGTVAFADTPITVHVSNSPTQLSGVSMYANTANYVSSTSAYDSSPTISSGAFDLYTITTVVDGSYTGYVRGSDGTHIWYSPLSFVVAGSNDPGPTVALAQLANISGHVDGIPSGATSVSVTASRSPYDQSVPQPYSVQPDSNGDFTLQGAGDGTYIVSISATYLNHTYSASQSNVVVAAGADVTSLSLSASTLANVSGSVSGYPAGATNISISGSDGQGHNLPNANVDAQGNFVIVGAQTGTYNAYVNWQLNSQSGTRYGQASNLAQIVVANSSDVTVPNVEIRKIVGTISGVPADPTSISISGSVPPQGNFPLYGSTIDNVTGGVGTFELYGAKAGAQYNLSAQLTSGGHAYRGTATISTAQSGDTTGATIALTEYVNITGSVTNIPSGFDVNSVQIQANSNSQGGGPSPFTGQFDSMSGSTRSYTLTGAVSGQTYSVRVTLTSGGRSYSGLATVSVASGDATAPSISLSALANITGTLTNVPTSIDSVSINGQSPNGGSYVYSWQLDAGSSSTRTYTLTGATPGQTYTLTFSIRSTSGRTYTGQTIVTVPGSGDATATSVPLASLANISGTITGIPANVPSLQVFASRNGGSSLQANVQRSSNGTATFTLTGASNGTYTLTAIDDSATKLVAGSASNVTVSAGADVTGIQIPVHSLTQHSLSGRVFDASGNAVAGATLNYSYAVEGSNQSGQATTDSNGQYSFGSIAADQLQSVSTQLMRTGVSGRQTNISGGFNQVDLTQGSTRDFTLNVGSGSISGTVTDQSTGNPISGITISASASSAGGNYASFSTTSDAQGQYELSGLPLGTSFYIYASQNYGQGSYESSNTTVRLSTTTSSKTKNISLKPVPTGTGSIAGTITEANTGQGYSAGDPISGVNVSAWRVGSSGASYPATSDTSGQYTLNNLPDGTYYVQTYKWDSQTGTSPYKWPRNNQTVTISNGNSVTKNVQLERYASGTQVVQGVLQDTNGNPISGANVNLYSMDGEGYRNLTTDSQGQWSVSDLAPGTWNIYFNKQGGNYEYAWDFAPVIVPQATTGAISRVDHLRLVTAGTSSIAGVLKDSKTHLPIEGAAITISRVAGGMTDVQTHTNSEGKYSVTSLADGQYRVSVQIDGYVTEKRTADKYYDWGGAQTLGLIDLSASEAAVLNGKLNPIPSGRGTISGTVRTSGGEIIENTWVSAISDTTGQWLGYVQTDETGTFSFEDIPFGEVTLTASPSSVNAADKYAYSQSTFTIDSTQPNRNVSIAAFRSGTISGTVSLPDQTAPKCVHATAYVRKADGSIGEQVSWANVDSGSGDSTKAGTYSLDYLAPGDYFVNFAQDCSWSDEKSPVNYGDAFWKQGVSTGSLGPVSTIHITEGLNVTDKNVTLSEGGTIQGTVTVNTAHGAVALPQGKFIRAQVYRLVGSEYVIQPQFENWVNARDAGKYTFTGLAAGTYKVLFTDTWTGNRGYESTYFGGATTLADAQTIVVSAGQSSPNVDVTLNVKIPVADPEAAGDMQLTAPLQDQISAPDAVQTNQTITVDVGTDLAGEYVSVWGHSDPVLLSNWVQVSPDGTVQVPISGDLPNGDHRIVVQDVEGAVVGWTETTVSGSSASGGSSDAASNSNASGVSRGSRTAASGAAAVLTAPVSESKASASPQASASGPAKSYSSQKAESVSQTSALLWLSFGIAVAVLLIAGLTVAVRRRRSTR